MGAIKLSGLLSLTLLVGCVTAPPQAQGVRLTSNPDAVHGCRFISNVSAWTGWGGTALGDANMDESLKAEAYKRGANVVFINSKSNGATGSQRASAEAYFCQQ